MKRAVEVFSIIVVLLTSVRWAPAYTTYYYTDAQGRWHQKWVDQNGQQHDRLSTMYYADTGKKEQEVGPPNLGPMTAGQRVQRFAIEKKVRGSSKSTVFRPKPTESPSNTAPKTGKVKSTESPSEAGATRDARFDGTWIAADVKNNPAGGQMRGTYTIVIKEGKSATKILDMINLSSANAPYNEVHRKWTCDSTDLRTTGASVTIQWSPGQFSDWAPRTISREEIESYGSPNAETSVYQLKGDELRRINDPNGVTYHRVK